MLAVQFWGTLTIISGISTIILILMEGDQIIPSMVSGGLFGCSIMNLFIAGYR